MKKEQNNLNVLILYTNYGSGHECCAKEIEKELKAQSNINVVRKNVHRIQNPFYTRTVEYAYNNFFTRYASNKIVNIFYSILYFLVNDIRLINYVFVQKKGTKIAEKIIEEECIDIIISTFPHYINTKKPCIVNITDYQFSKAWKSKKDYLYILSNQYDMEKLLKAKINREKIILSQIPVSSKFNVSNNNVSLNRILFNLGARGQVNFKQLKKTITKLLIGNLQIGVMTGKNEKLAQKLENQFGNQIEVYRFSNEVYNIINQYDLVVTKAGGLSISECIQSEKPIIVNLSQTLSGQERANFKYILKGNIGDGCYERNLYEKILEYIEDDNKYKEQVKNLKNIKKEFNSRKTITEIIGDIYEGRIST